MTQDQTPSLRFPEFRGAWAVKPLSGVIKVITPPKKLPTREYDKTGSFPIIDQSKSQISGWTDDKESIIDKGLPLIIFGDHTCVIKIAKNPFAQGADGIKIFGGSSDLTTEYLYQYLQFKPLESKEYKRHFSLLKERKVFYPDKKSGEMQKITECLSSLDEVITIHGDRLDGLKDYKRGLMQQIFPADGQTTPTLRFPEFQGKDPWEEKRLGDVLDKKSSTIAANTLENIEGIYPIYGASGLLKNINFYDEEKQYIAIIKDGAGVGRLMLCPPKSSVLGTLDKLHAKTPNNLHFLYYFCCSQVPFKNYIIGSTIPHIYFKDYAKNKIQVPPLAEQEKIAECFLSLDEVITIHGDRLDGLKDYKRGLMQQLFPAKGQTTPTLRFPEFSNTGAWKVKKMADLFSNRQEKGFLNLPLLSLTEKEGIIPQEKSNRRNTSNVDKSKYLRVCLKDIAYNTMRMWEGRSAFVDLEGIVSPAYTICKPKDQVDGLFFSYYFKTPMLIKIFRMYSQGLVNDTLSLKFLAFSKISILTPPLAEQQKIADYLSALDDLITVQKQKIKDLKHHKNGLMQQLFSKL